MIYLDYQATTPLAPEARSAMLPYLDEKFGNPHSPHRLGREAAAAVDVAREQVASLLPSGGRLAFTSGATESLNWAIKGSHGPIVTSATEHAAVLDSVRAAGQAERAVTILTVGADGLIDLDAARVAIAPGTGLVAIMLVNNEIGVIQPVEQLAELAHAAGALFLCDAVQGYGRVAIPANCDLVAISAHKVHGPKGIGALWVRDGVTLDPLLHGGGQEAPGRSGTLAPMLCAGFGAAATLMASRADVDAAHVARLWLLATRHLGPEWRINGSAEHRYRGNLNVRRDGIDSARLISGLRGLAFSAGSACASGSGRPSHVLKALGLTDRQARSSIRLGFGRYTSESDIGAAMTMILDAAARQAMWAA
ncbi:MAG: cysteine desulfurase family protein [Pseudomonadota bacterium]